MVQLLRDYKRDRIITPHTTKSHRCSPSKSSGFSYHLFHRLYCHLTGIAQVQLTQMSEIAELGGRDMFLSEKPVYDKFCCSQVFREKKYWHRALKAIMPTISRSIFLRKAESRNLKGTVL